MDTPPPPGVDNDLLSAALACSWGVTAQRLRYVPKGLGSYHWVVDTTGSNTLFLTVDDLDVKPWLAPDRDATFDALTRCYGAASGLRRDARLAFVVSPLPTIDGRSLVRLAPQHSLSVYPYITGEPGEWGRAFSAEARLELVRLLADLHRATPTVASHALPRCLSIPDRAVLEEALADLDRPWTAGPFADSARRTLASRADAVREWLDDFDRVAARVGEPQQPVITHGEPHPGNLIESAQGLMLIDWDTVALAHRERDLWMLDDESLDAYDVAVDRDALDLYRLAWTLTDIALFTQLFRSPHQVHEGTDVKLRGLGVALSGASPDPHAVRLDRSPLKRTRRNATGRM